MINKFYDPACLEAGAVQAVERARSRSWALVEPDDLLAGLLLSVSRFGIIELGRTAIDLEAVGLTYDAPAPDLSVRPSYSPASVAIFDRAARLAGRDGRPLAPLYLLVALADPNLPTFRRLSAADGIDAKGWRRLLAAVPPPANASSTGSGERPTLGTLLSPEEAAGKLRVHIQTLRGYIRSGRLPAFRIAGERAIRIRIEDLADLLEHLSSRPAATDAA